MVYLAAVVLLPVIGFAVGQGLENRCGEVEPDVSDASIGARRVLLVGAMGFVAFVLLAAVLEIGAAIVERRRS